MHSVLVINAGSSSIKFQLFAVAGGNELTRLLKGRIEGIGVKPMMLVEGRDAGTNGQRLYSPMEVPDVPTAMRQVWESLSAIAPDPPSAVGHRVVHGGPEFHRPVALDPATLDKLEKLIPLAPLHQPNNLAPIRALMTQSPGLAQVACFDTAFHRGHPEVADRFAIPEAFYAQGIRRYGFHGLSYEYIAQRLREIDPRSASGRVIVAHLGSGASMCAMVDGRSVESTMGFTALDGLPMGTRPGQIDPGVILYLLANERMSAQQLERLLYHDCGLKGLSGISNDVRELLASHRPEAALAIEYFVYRTICTAGALASAMSGLDAFVFTAGIGENAAEIRARIATGLEWLGVQLDLEANQRADTQISTPQSRIKVYVLPTDEELMIARHTLAVLNLGGVP